MIKSCVICGNQFSTKTKKLSCSDECHTKHRSFLYLTRSKQQQKEYRERTKEHRSNYNRTWYQQNKELVKSRSKADLDYMTKTTPVIQEILSTFEELEDEQHRQEYAEWVLFLADTNNNYRRALGNYKVDDWLADYYVAAA